MFKACLFCLKEFTPKLYSTKKGSKKRYSTAKYCSSNCMAKDRYYRNHKYYEEYWKKDSYKWQKKRICVVCKKEYLPITKNQLQCSVQCTRKKWKKAHWDKVLEDQRERFKKKAREDWKKKKCKYCNNIFFPKLSNKNQQIYCSINCQRKSLYYRSRENGKYKINKVNYRKNNKEKIRKSDEEYKARINFGVTSKTLNKRLVIERDKKLCRMCGNKYQVIHHIRYSGKLEDLVLLCRSCHASLHAKIKQPPYLLL